VSIPVTMPQFGETIAEGTITRWLRAVGDSVSADDPLLEVSTDKVEIEVPAPAAGTVIQILVPDGTTVNVGTVLALIGDRPEAAVSDVLADGRPPATARSGSAAGQATSAVAVRPRHRHSPRVRRLALENGISADRLVGTGPAGRVTPADVLRAAADSRADVPRHEPARYSGPSLVPDVRQQANRLETRMGVARARSSKAAGSNEAAAAAVSGVAAQRQPPGHTQVIEVDLTRVLAQAGPASPGVRGVLPATLFVAKAVLESLQAHPQLNASIDAYGRVIRHARQDLGVAFHTPDGPLVQVLHDVGGLNLTGLERRLAELSERTLSGDVEPSDLTGGSFTLSDAASRGILWDIPVLDGPQAAVLSVGTPVQRPIVVHGMGAEIAVAVRSVAFLALTHDRRIRSTDGAEFLATVKAKLEAARLS
jgi:pyruvate dehydrogenase E2 component (dihydrolipoamide acetyltransferase)